MRHKERQVTDPAAIADILQSGLYLQLALCQDNQPYVVALNYGFTDSAIYVHSFSKGKKIETLRANPKVSFSVVVDASLITPPDGTLGCDFSMRFRSVIGFGTATILSDPEEVRRGLDIIVAHYSPGHRTYDPKVLAVTSVVRIDIDSLTAMRKNLD